MEKAIFILSLWCGFYFQHKIAESSIFARKVELSIEENQRRGYPSHFNYKFVVADEYVKIKKPNTYGSEHSKTTFLYLKLFLGHREYWIIQIPNLLTNIHSIEKISVFFCRQNSTLDDGNISSIAFDLNYTEETYNFNENDNNLCRVVSFKRNMLYDTKTNRMLKKVTMSTLGYDIYSHSSSIRVTVYFNKTFKLMRRFSRVDRSLSTDQTFKFTNHCRRVPLTVSFYDIGWSDKIVAPSRYHSYKCVGHCSLAYMTVSGNSTNHSIIRGLLINEQNRQRYKRSKSGQKEFHDDLLKDGNDFITPPCCVPITYKPFQILVYQENQMTVKEIDNIVVDSCGCR